MPHSETTETHTDLDLALVHDEPDLLRAFVSHMYDEYLHEEQLPAAGQAAEPEPTEL